MQSGKAEPLLQVEHLTFGYQQGKNTLEDIDFTIYKGEMISIVGRNGAGKSTLAKLICGFELPVSGRILLEGRDLLNDTIRERAEKIGYVMQNPNQMISKPMIWDEVELALLKMGMTEEERKEQALLRAEYIDSVRQNLRSTLANVSIQEADGTITPLTKKNKH